MPAGQDRHATKWPLSAQEARLAGQRCILGDDGTDSLSSDRS